MRKEAEQQPCADPLFLADQKGLLHGVEFILGDRKDHFVNHTAAQQFRHLIERIDRIALAKAPLVQLVSRRWIDHRKAVQAVAAILIGFDGARNFKRPGCIADEQKPSPTGKGTTQSPAKPPRKQPEKHHGHKINDGVETEQQATDILDLQDRDEGEEQGGGDKRHLNGVRKNPMQHLFPDFPINASGETHASARQHHHRRKPEIVHGGVEGPHTVKVSTDAVRCPETRACHQRIGQYVKHADHPVVSREHGLGGILAKGRYTLPS